MMMILDDEMPRPVLPPEEVDAVLIAFALLEAKSIISKLETACDKALTLRGLMAAINDPLALEGEKQDLRGRFMKIEIEIRAAIIAATEFRRKQK